MRSGGEEFIRRIGVARTPQVLRQGSNASDAVLFVHRILRVLIEQPGLAPRWCRILMSVHAVFPYGWGAPPCTIPVVFKALPASLPPPP